MATETFLESPWLEPPAFSSKGLTESCVVLSYANRSYDTLSVMTSYFIDHLLCPDQQSNGNACGFSAYTTWQRGRGGREWWPRFSFTHPVHFPQLAVSQLWVKEVPWNPVCPPSKNVKNKERPVSRSVSVTLLWNALTISSLRCLNLHNRLGSVRFLMFCKKSLTAIQ